MARWFGRWAGRWSARLGPYFRLPRAGDPPPVHSRLAAICGWAAALGLAGLVAGLQALITLLVVTPAWYEPTVIAIGLLGIGCAIAALTSVHRPGLPYALLGAATAALLLAFSVSAAV